MTEEDRSNSELKALGLKMAGKPAPNRLLRLVTLVNNMKKSPWLLSRCKESHSHMQALMDLLRPEDAITVAIKLESLPTFAYLNRYLVLISNGEKHVAPESAILGVDIVRDDVTIGLVLPISDNMDIQMDGDGGFNICAENGKHSFHPVSVQAMWSALQSLVKAVCFARYHHQNTERIPFSWLSQYHLSSSQDFIFEWNRIIDADFTCQRTVAESTDDVKLLLSIKRKLRDIMTNENDIDLETITSKYLREKLEVALNMNLNAYKRFVDEEMVIVMRQMDSPSQILDYMYLGSEWNASNLEELQRNRIGYILNVTREIDNFFPGMFKYCNVRVDDTEETQLVRHWNSTYKFIAEAKKNNSRILVHCKMGVSRSASTVIAYVMKECGKPFLEAYQYVKQKRSCVKPNAGFMDQLNTYEGILGASKQRHNKLFRSRSAETLDREIVTEDERNNDDAQTEDENAMDSNVDVVSTDDLSSDANSDDSKTRPATFSIDSVDSFSSGSLPAISELKQESLTEFDKLALVEVDEDEVLCDSIGSGISQGNGALLPQAVLNDLGLPDTSMLRKLSIQNEICDGETYRKHDECSESVRKIKKAESVTEMRTRKRSQSWPRTPKDIVHMSVKRGACILRPTTDRHRQLRKRRSNTIAFDD